MDYPQLLERGEYAVHFRDHFQNVVVNRSHLEFYAVEPQVYAARVERLPAEDAEALAQVGSRPEPVAS